MDHNEETYDEIFDFYNVPHHIRHARLNTLLALWTTIAQPVTNAVEKGDLPEGLCLSTPWFMNRYKEKDNLPDHRELEGLNDREVRCEQQNAVGGCLPPPSNLQGWNGPACILVSRKQPIRSTDIKYEHVP